MGLHAEQLRPHHAEVVDAQPRRVAWSRARRLLIRGVQVYQRSLSKRFRGYCMYEPSCSEYAIEALERHGSLRGTVLAVRRFVRCRPPYEGGRDPVP